MHGQHISLVKHWDGSQLQMQAELGSNTCSFAVLEQRHIQVKNLEPDVDDDSLKLVRRLS